ncbi:ATP-binding protein [Streptomyces collinus]|uniref:ATP-binding protein n=1 Tax=Streptomyces collinus TaxID=42684 RepID=UPI0036B1DAAF
MIDLLAGRRLFAEDGAPVVTRTFPRQPNSVSQAREFVHAALVDWKLSDLADAAEVVTSELATNAVQHARCGAYRVTLRRLGDDCVRVAVIDRSRAKPEMAKADDDMEHGRGLALVAAMSARWGTEPLDWGKRVWADLTVPPKPEPPAPQIPIYGTCRAQVVYVLILAAVATAVVLGMAAPH